MTAQSARTTHYRTVWLSDIHLGARGAQAEAVLGFLRHTECDTLYLVGDIVDGWKLRRSWYWPQPHNDVVQKLLRKARKGTAVYFVPGNHDEFARDYVGYAFGDVAVCEQAVHETADGRRLLVVHGDAFDVATRYAPWLAKLGDLGYSIALGANRAFNAARRRLGYPYWSLSAWLKVRVKHAVSAIGAYEQALSHAARQAGVDGVVCGHIHQPQKRVIDGLEYYNCGDWVESCTALVEHEDGRVDLAYWHGPASLPSSYGRAESEPCASYSSPMPGIPRSTVSSAPSASSAASSASSATTSVT